MRNVEKGDVRDSVGIAIEREFPRRDIWLYFQLEAPSGTDLCSRPSELRYQRSKPAK
jgi:hypothetical protein